MHCYFHLNIFPGKPIAIRWSDQTFFGGSQCVALIVLYFGFCKKKFTYFRQWDFGIKNKQHDEKCNFILNACVSVCVCALSANRLRYPLDHYSKLEGI